MRPQSELSSIDMELARMRRDSARQQAEIERLRLALRIIAGQEQCIDNLMSNADVAREALNSR